MFSLYPFFFYLYLYLLSNTEREKRQTREREITRPFEWIDSAQSSLGFSYFYFVRSFRLLAKELAKFESNWKHVRYTSICKHAFYIFIYISIPPKKGSIDGGFRVGPPPGSWRTEPSGKKQTQTTDVENGWKKKTKYFVVFLLRSKNRTAKVLYCYDIMADPT